MAAVLNRGKFKALVIVEWYASVNKFPTGLSFKVTRSQLFGVKSVSQSKIDI